MALFIEEPKFHFNRSNMLLVVGQSFWKKYVSRINDIWAHTYTLLRIKWLFAFCDNQIMWGFIHCWYSSIVIALLFLIPVAKRYVQRYNMLAFSAFVIIVFYHFFRTKRLHKYMGIDLYYADMCIDMSTLVFAYLCFVQTCTNKKRNPHPCLLQQMNHSSIFTLVSSVHFKGKG